MSPLNPRMFLEYGLKCQFYLPNAYPKPHVALYTPYIYPYLIPDDWLSYMYPEHRSGVRHVPSALNRCTSKYTFLKSMLLPMFSSLPVDDLLWGFPFLYWISCYNLLKGSTVSSSCSFFFSICCSITGVISP